jgi:NAD(P)-dependent dehydrogenase (short-subunit alcohol dehydrogenase family)
MTEIKRIALVTGANKGIGFEIARQLAKQGITVLLGARDGQKGEEAASKLRDESFDVYFLKVDVNDIETHENAAKYIEEKFGKLDILVNNAGVSLDKGVPVSQSTLEQWRGTFETNVFGTIALTQKLLPLN